MQGSKKGLLIALALLVAVLVCAGLGYRMLAGRTQSEQSQAAPEQSEPANTSAPTYPLLAEHDPTVYTEEGEAITFSQIADGKPLVVNFWATWCPYCVKEMPDYQQIVADYGDRVNFAFVDVTDGKRETREKAQEFLAENGFAELPAYYDTDLAASIEYNASSLPTTAVIDSKGQILSVQAGMIKPVLLRDQLDRIA